MAQSREHSASSLACHCR